MSVKFDFSSSPTDVPNYQLPSLRSFKGLSSLSVSSNYSLPSTYYQNEIRPVAEGSPRLTRFCLSIKDDKLTVPPLHAILGTTSRPDLTDLVLEDVPLLTGSLDHFITKNLRHLTLSAEPPTRRRGRIAWPYVWAALRNSGVQLPSLSVGFFEEAANDLFDYLRSYSGLQELKITGVHWKSEPFEDISAAQAAEDSAGRVFWNEVVPNHKNSLVELAVHPEFEGMWCYGPLASDAIRKCTSLRKLAIRGYRLQGYDNNWITSRMTELADNGGCNLGGWEPGKGPWRHTPLGYIPVRDISYYWRLDYSLLIWCLLVLTASDNIRPTKFTNSV